MLDVAWLDGWLGAVLAAALTVGATVAWDARARRRGMLDEALLRMGEAADQLAVAVLHRPAEDAALLIQPVVTAALRASAVAGRPVGVLPAAVLAPARWGAARQIESVMTEFGAALGDMDDQSVEGRSRVAENCARLTLIANLWWRRPMSFLRRKPLRVVDGFADELADGLDRVLRGP